MRNRLREKLKQVIDPELGVNIVDLGLIYGIEIDKDGNVNITMTMTSPMCPLVSVIEKSIRDMLERLEDVNDVHVKIVWEPPWSPDKMSQEAKLQLGYAGAVNGNEHAKD